MGEKKIKKRGKKKKEKTKTKTNEVLKAVNKTKLATFKQTLPLIVLTFIHVLKIS